MNDRQDLEQRITELESQVSYLENTVDDLNRELSTFSQQFLLAKEAMQLMNKRLESLQSGSNEKSPTDNQPPPHY